MIRFTEESEETKRLYGLDNELTRPFGEVCLAARRLSETGVRFVQVYHGGAGNAWDSHKDLKKNHGELASKVDKPIAGLLKDLRQRGLLDETIVVWATEFGRTPGAENSNGRDHHPFGFSTWMAGGGIKGGIIHGSTDEIGFQRSRTGTTSRTSMRLSCTSSGSILRNWTCPDGKDWTSTTALRSKKSWFSLLAILAACTGPVRAAQPWTVDAILSVPALGDPQIRPDGRQVAYVRRSLAGKAWRDVIFVSPVPAGPAQEIGRGSRPRWSPDSRRLGYLHGQVYVGGSAVTHSPSPPLSYSWTPDGTGIAYLAADPGPEPDPIVADQDYRYTRLYIQPLSGGEPRRLTTADRHVVSFALSPDGTRAVYAAQATPRNRDSFDCDLYETDLRTLAERPIVVQSGRDADPLIRPIGNGSHFTPRASRATILPRVTSPSCHPAAAPSDTSRVIRTSASMFFAEAILSPGRAMAAFSTTQRGRVRGMYWSGRMWPQAVWNPSSIALHRRGFTPDPACGVFLSSNNTRPEIV